MILFQLPSPRSRLQETGRSARLTAWSRKLTSPTWTGRKTRTLAQRQVLTCWKLVHGSFQCHRSEIFFASDDSILQNKKLMTSSLFDFECKVSQNLSTDRFHLFCSLWYRFIITSQFSSIDDFSDRKEFSLLSILTGTVQGFQLD